MQNVIVKNGAIALNVTVTGQGPLIVCVHGWPELAYSWRHQLGYFSQQGYTVAAFDVRGYGGSSKPHPIADYSMRCLASDVAAVIDHFNQGPAILFGHDWGAPIVWNTSLLYPDKVRAVAGLSVPYRPRGPVSFLEMAKIVFADRFFYQIYFQEEGKAEAELEADVAASLRRFYYIASGNAADVAARLPPKAKDARLLDGIPDPDPFPDWLSAEDLDVYINAFRQSGFRGPLNRYRAQNIDHAELADFDGALIAQPAFFIGGEKDGVRAFIPGMDLYADTGAFCSDFRGAEIIPRAGHWVQQEAPEATNKALHGFLNGLTK